MTQTINGDVSRLVKGSFYSFGSLIAVKLIMAVNSIIVARLLTPESLGLLTILDQIYRVIFMLACLGIPLALVKFISEFAVIDSEKIKQYISMAFSLIILFASIFCGMYFIFRGRFALFYNQPILNKLIVYSAIMIFFLTLWEVLSAILRGLHQIKTYSTLNIIRWFIIIPVNIVFILLFDLTGAVLALMVCAVINVVILFVVVKRKSINLKFSLFALSFKYDIMKKFFGFGLPASISDILVGIPMWVAISYLSKQVSFESVGLYKVSYSLLLIIMFIPMAIAIPIVPIFSELEKRNTKRMEKFFHQSIRLTAIIMIPVVFGLAVFSKYIIPAFFGMKYIQAWQFMALMCSGVYLYSLCSIIGYLIAGTGRMWQGSLLNLIWSALFIILTFPLIKSYGLMGFGLAYVFTYLVHTVTSYIYVKVSFGLHLAHLAKIMLLALLAGCAAYVLLAATFMDQSLMIIVSLFSWAILVVICYKLLNDREKSMITVLMKSIKSRFSRKQT